MVQKSAAFSSLLGGAYALTMRQSGCSFHMRTEGALSAPVSQYDSGQTRAGPNETPSSFTLNGNTLTDAKGRGCWWTPPAMVLQCDVGQVPESGFSVGCDGTVSYNGQTTFYECETGANDLRMIYSGPNGSRCSEITLHADGCYPSGCSGQGSGSGSGSASPAPSGTNTLPLGGSTTYPAYPSSPAGGGSGSGSGSGSTPPGNSPSGTSPGSGPGGASPGISGTGTQPLGGSTTYPGPPSYPTGTIGTSPGGVGSTPPGQYPGGTQTGGISNGASPTPSGSTPPGGAGSSTPSGHSSGSTSSSTTPNGENSTPSGQYPVSTPIGSTPTGGSGSTPPGQYPGSTPSESTPSGGAGSTPPGQSPGGTPSESTPNGASPTPSGNTTPAGSGTGSSTPGQYPTEAGNSPASTPSAPGQTGTPGSSCPGELTGAYQYPHLIIPVNSAKADSAPGTSQFGEVTSTISTAFNFDIPQSDSGKTCNLVFYFPTQSQLETSSYTFSGSGAVEFGRLSSPVTKGTSYSNLPNIAQSYGQKSVTPGSGHTISSFACPAGQIVAFEMKAAKGDASTSFRYFQDWNPCPIGLYITVS